MEKCRDPEIKDPGKFGNQLFFTGSTTSFQ